MPRLSIRGMIREWTFDAKPMNVISANELYVSGDGKHVIKLVDTDYINHFRGIFSYFNPRLMNSRRTCMAAAQSMDLDPTCFRAAISSWEKAFPIDFGPARLDGEKRDCGIVNHFLSGHPLDKSFKRNLKISTDVVKKLIRTLICEVAIIHQANIVHMDLTPANVIMDDIGGEVYIIDWDIAQIAGSDITAMVITFPNDTSVPLPPGFDPTNCQQAPNTFFDVWYLPVDIVNIIASFDRDLVDLFGGQRPTLMFFIDFPTPGKLVELKRLVESDRNTGKTWPPQYDTLRRYKYLQKKVKKEHVDRFREIISKYINPELIYSVYLEGADGRRPPKAQELHKFI